jgi:hypothetical protein
VSPLLSLQRAREQSFAEMDNLGVGAEQPWWVVGH